MDLCCFLWHWCYFSAGVLCCGTVVFTGGGVVFCCGGVFNGGGVVSLAVSLFLWRCLWWCFSAIFGAGVVVLLFSGAVVLFSVMIVLFSVEVIFFQWRWCSFHWWCFLLWWCFNGGVVVSVAVVFFSGCSAIFSGGVVFCCGVHGVVSVAEVLFSVPMLLFSVAVVLFSVAVVLFQGW